MNKATVIIPTTGSKVFSQAVQSVISQTIPTSAYIVVDGNQYFDLVFSTLKEMGLSGDPRIKICNLPENVGANGFYGHRIYAAFPHLINTDYILFLDQDCWFDSGHVESMISTIERSNLSWAYSLRKITNKDGSFICNDDCESLGKWKPVFDYNHVDTNCYCIKTKILTKISQVWHGGWGTDRLFYSIIDDHFPEYSCTGKYTLNYRLDGNDGSVKSEFFLNWNNIVRGLYGTNLPWSE